MHDNTQTELVISVQEDNYRIALLKERRLVEYHSEEKNHKFSVGDIYLGTIKKVVSGLNAAFVDIGDSRDAFLHYLDLSPKFQYLDEFVSNLTKQNSIESDISSFDFKKDIEKNGKIQDVLSIGQTVLVQVVKEPISTKGPRLSCELSIAGRYCILLPFNNEINISRKITNINERKRLFRLISSIKPKNYGVIVRTNSQNKEVAELDKDLKSLHKKWLKGTKILKNAFPRQKIIGEVSRTSTILRDVLNESFDKITVDDEIGYNDIKSFIKRIFPEKEKIVKLYKGKIKIFEKFGIEKQIKSSFGQIVSIAGGGYLVIEHTEAMHVIDVNSGNRSYSTTDDQQGIALMVNRSAAKEIARQLRLRDMGGIIVVDFIDLKDPDKKNIIYEDMKQYLKDDRSKTSVYKLTKLGIMQITRQRVRPEMNISTKEQCPSCGGTGEIDPSIIIADKIEKNIHELIENHNEKKLTLYVHPYLYAYFTKGLISKYFKWFFKFGILINLQQDTSLGITGYKFLNSKGEEIEIDM